MPTPLCINQYPHNTNCAFKFPQCITWCDNSHVKRWYIVNLNSMYILQLISYACGVTQTSNGMTITGSLKHDSISTTYCKIAVTPLSTHWSYYSLALNLRYKLENISQFPCLQIRIDIGYWEEVHTMIKYHEPMGPEVLEYNHFDSFTTL